MDSITDWLSMGYALVTTLRKFGLNEYLSWDGFVQVHDQSCKLSPIKSPGDELESNDHSYGWISQALSRRLDYILNYHMFPVNFYSSHISLKSCNNSRCGIFAMHQANQFCLTVFSNYSKTIHPIDLRLDLFHVLYCSILYTYFYCR